MACDVDVALYLLGENTNNQAQYQRHPHPKAVNSHQKLKVAKRLPRLAHWGLRRFTTVISRVRR